MYLLSVAYNNNSAYIELLRKNNLSPDHYDIWAYPKFLTKYHIKHLQKRYRSSQAIPKHYSKCAK